ncbi:MAG TPA: hypothetical protein DCL44_04100 [Elusimicrobia bacterium]|nr:hypothetical protein [Elusimicrobiota bacterium]
MRNRLLGVLACLSLVSCAFALDGNITFDQTGSVSQMVSRLKAANPGAEIIPLPQVQAAASKEWTVMVYVNAKNNLEEYGLKDVNEMEMVGSDANVNVVAELGRIAGYSTADGDWKSTRRYLVQKDANLSAITSPVVMEIAKTDMGDWNHLVEFTKWAMSNYPARHYALVVWNHGSGWNKDVTFESEKGISYDDESRNHITTPQLRQAMEQIGKIDILSMDACLMQMVEVGYEVKNYAEYIVASEETEPGDGYTYNTWLGPLAAKPGMSSAELSIAMVNSYGDHYQSVNQGATQSAIKTAALDKFTVLINDWAAEVMKAGELANAKSARSKAQAFYYASNKDVYHFVKLVDDAAASQAVVAKGKTLLGFIKSDVVISNRAIGAKYANATGLAIYIPTAYTASYDVLKWAADSNWDDFIKWMK